MSFLGQSEQRAKSERNMGKKCLSKCDKRQIAIGLGHIGKILLRHFLAEEQVKSPKVTCVEVRERKKQKLNYDKA